MARTYSKSPLIEAVCDFRFSSSQPWDWTIPGLFYEQIRDMFPVKEQLNAVETLIDPNQGKFIQQAQPKLQFASEAHDAVIQVAPDNLSIHQLRPYDGWINFKKRTLEYLQMYGKAAAPTGLINIGLRYVNHIELPYTKMELEDYFHVLPHVPHPIPQIFPSFLLNVDVPYDSPISGLRITFGTVVPKTLGNFAYVLDLHMFSTNDAIPAIDQIADWLESAHERIEVVFDASFTDKTRSEIFEEVKK